MNEGLIYKYYFNLINSPNLRGFGVCRREETRREVGIEEEK